MEQKIVTSLRPYEALVSVDYRPLPPLTDLEKEFGKVDTIFDGQHRFERHASCVSVNETPGERVMSVAMPPHELGTTEEIIAWMDRQGCRPSTEQEFIAFVRARPALNESHPYLKRFGWIKSLGSFARPRNDRRLRYVPELTSYAGGQPALGFDYFDNAGRRGSAFLLVRKDISAPDDTLDRHEKLTPPTLSKEKGEFVSIVELCEENGYRIGDPDINDGNFPPLPRSSLRSVSGSMLLFDTNTTADVLRKLSAKKAAPATIFSLTNLRELAHGIRYIALGSWILRDRKKYYPFLYADGRETVLGLTAPSNGCWHEGDIFFGI